MTHPTPEIEEDAYVLDAQVGYLMRLANQRHSSLFQDTMPFNLTATQFAALVKLYENGTCSQNELGRQTAMDVATIKGVVICNATMRTAVRFLRKNKRAMGG